MPIIPNFPSGNTYHKQKHYKKKNKIEVSLPHAKKETRIGAVETKCVEKLVVAACSALWYTCTPPLSKLLSLYKVYAY